MADLSKLYVVRGDVEPEYKEKIVEWSDTWHMPDLLEAGFWAATRFRCLEGEPEYLHLYEIPGPELFETDAYRYICRCDPPCGTLKCQNKQDLANPSGPQMIRHFKRGSRMVYDQILTHSPAGTRNHSPGRDGDPVASVPGKILLNIRMDVEPAIERDFEAWQEQVHMPEAKAWPGFISGRIGRRIDSFSTDEPKYLVIWEVENVEAIKNRPPLAERNISEDEKRIRAGVLTSNEAIAVRIFPKD